LPQPTDVIAVIRKNHNREMHVDKTLIAAFTWLTEFSDAWTK
jgi:hypothetical protein